MKLNISHIESKNLDTYIDKTERMKTNVYIPFKKTEKNKVT